MMYQTLWVRVPFLMKTLLVALTQGMLMAKAWGSGASVPLLRTSLSFLTPLAVLSIILYTTVPASALTLMGRVVSVQEGDQITVAAPGEQPFQVRLFGIATPHSDQAYASDARIFTTKAVLGKDIRIVVEAYRRGETSLTGTVLVGDQNLNEALVRKGYAWWFRREAPSNIFLKQLEFEARTAKSGLWAGRSPVAPWLWERRRSISPPKKQPVYSTGKVCDCPCCQPASGQPSTNRGGTTRRFPTNLNDLAPP